MRWQQYAGSTRQASLVKTAAFLSSLWSRALRMLPNRLKQVSISNVLWCLCEVQASCSTCRRLDHCFPNSSARRPLCLWKITTDHNIPHLLPHINMECQDNRYPELKICVSELILRSGHTERGLPQRTAVSVRCGMLHSKQTLLTIVFWKHSS